MWQTETAASTESMDALTSLLRSCDTAAMDVLLADPDAFIGTYFSNMAKAELCFLVYFWEDTPL